MPACYWLVIPLAIPPSICHIKKGKEANKLMRLLACMIISAGAPENLTWRHALSVILFICFISWSVTLQESSSNKTASVVQTPTTPNCLRSLSLWPMKETKQKLREELRFFFFFYLFSFSNRCCACQLGTDSLIYWSGCVSGICKCIFLLICSSHCHMPPNPQHSIQPIC